MEETPKEKNEGIEYSYSVNMNLLEQENKALRDTVNHLRTELEKVKVNPLMVCEVLEMQGENAIIRIPNGNMFQVTISEDAGKIAPGDSVLAEQKNLTILKKLDFTTKYNVEQFVIINKPTTSWSEVGGLEKEKEELTEVVELPLLKPHLFKEIGISPPKGVLLYGPPGTGKTLLAKAVAASTNATFIQIVGSELVQKFIGEGAKLVKEIFDLARAKAPAVIFIDEIDAIASKRIEIGTSGEREVQRTFMQLLAEIDGFKPLDNVKIIGATNRKDILDSAVIRPGRLDRMIEIPLPDESGRLQIMKIHSKAMKLEKTVKLNELVKKMEFFSGAEIKATCTEAGYFAIRENRKSITKQDFERAVMKIKQEEEFKEHLHMFG